jgi:hypothetical membrane protein
MSATAGSRVSAINPTQHEGDATSRLLLWGGVLVGPLYLVTGLVQAFMRPGFDLSKHSLSQLAIGDFGWIQSTNLLVSGLLVLGAAAAIRQVFAEGRGRTWGPVLLSVYGLGMIGAAFFQADPALGFPPGTPSDQAEISWHGGLHFLCAGLGFLGLVASSIILGRRGLASGQPLWGAYSIATGVAFLIAFIGGGFVAGASGNPTLAVLSIWIAVVLAWAWLSITCLRLLPRG